VKFTNKKMCQILGRDRKSQADDYGTGACGYAPALDGGYRYWAPDDIVAELFFLDHRADGYPVKLAGQMATRLREGMHRDPDADQLTIVRLENGSTFTMATNALDLRTGFISGSYVRTALTVDVRQYRERIQRLIASDAEIIGGEDD
jgi:hypothetical protein